VLPITNGVRANKTDFVKLLQVLSDAHSQDICHRDVKPENIFKDENGRVILSDWGSAVTAGESVPWQGTRFYYDAPAGRYHTPEPADDLVALVRSVFAMYTNDMPSERTTNRTMEASSLWRGALQCARKSDYGGLQDFFNGL
jgi:serine/threonine protein kinase